MLLPNYLFETNISTELFKLYNLDKITTPEKLSSWMHTNFSYWQHDESNVESFDEILKSKKGDCYDQVEFEKIMFNKMNIKYSCLFMIEYKDSNWQQGYGTHALLYYKKNNKFYWFENAWGKYYGIHQYDSLDELKEDLFNKWQFNYGCDRLLITSLGKVHPGMSHSEYAYECTKKFNKKPTSGVYKKK